MIIFLCLVLLKNMPKSQPTVCCVENQVPGARGHPSAGPQVSSRLPGAQLPLPGLRDSPVRPPGGLQVLLLPGPQVGGPAGHLRQAVLPPGEPHHLPRPARLRPPLSGGLVLEHWLGRHHHQHRKWGNWGNFSLGLELEINYISDRQLKYEAALRLKKSIQDSEQKIPEPLKIDVMSLEGHESF